MLENLPEFDIGRVAEIEPDTWKNVGVSIMHSTKILKE